MASILTLPALIGLAFAGGAGAQKGLVNAIPVASASPNASYADGFPILTMTNPTAGGVPPAGADFNGILNAITTFQCWANAGGQYPFNAALAATIGGYPIGAVLQLNGGLGCVVSTVNGNSTDPNSSMTGWLPYGGAFPNGQVLVGSGTGTVGNANLTYAPTLATGGLTIANTTPCTGTGVGSLIINGGVAITTLPAVAGSSVFGLQATVTPTATGTYAGSMVGVQGSVNYSGASNLTATNGMIGIYGFVSNATTGTTTGITGLCANVQHTGSGTTSSLTGVFVTTSKTAGTVGTAFGIYINGVTAGSNYNYGLVINAVSGGATANYAIQTSAGIVSIGDTTVSTSSTVGALVVAGGIGCNGVVTVQGTSALNTIQWMYSAPTSGGVACVLTPSYGPTGASTSVLGWIRINVSGGVHFVPYW